MKKYKSRGILFALLLSLVLAFSACGGGMVEESFSPQSEQSAGNEAAAYDVESDYGLYGGESAAEAPASAAPDENSSDSFEDTDGTADVAAVSDSSRKITFSADFSINTKNFDADYSKINGLITGSGGYVAGENTENYGNNQGRVSYFSARVPADKLDDVIEGMEEIGEVTRKNKSSEDLTDQYFDTEARIELLEMRRERLLGYLETTTEPEDIIQFERELSSVLYDLDQYQGSKRKMDNLVEYATIDISLYELITPETIGADGEPLGDRAKSAMELSFINVQNFLADAAVFFAAAFPIILLIVVIVIVIIVICRVIIMLRRKYLEKHPKPEKLVRVAPAYAASTVAAAQGADAPQGADSAQQQEGQGYVPPVYQVKQPDYKKRGILTGVIFVISLIVGIILLNVSYYGMTNVIGSFLIIVAIVFGILSAISWVFHFTRKKNSNRL